ncbi:MAG: hypothetical protein LBG28_06955 [Tannerella sp.]|nr:hypothetical protein [Tannerella sp.]
MPPTEIASSGRSIAEDGTSQSLSLISPSVPKTLRLSADAYLFFANSSFFASVSDKSQPSCAEQKPSRAGRRLNCVCFSHYTALPASVLVKAG